jgi:hypothetical protein
VTRLHAVQLGFESQQGQGRDFFLHHLHTVSVLQLAFCTVGMGGVALSLGIKWPGCEAKHSPPHSLRIRIFGAVHLCGMVLRCKDNFALMLHIIGGLKQ